LVGPSDKWQVFVFGKNLTDETYRLFASSTTFGYSAELMASPREWGLGARFTF
jgi:outer membrane receptor protein involved in Fe transport